MIFMEKQIDLHETLWHGKALHIIYFVILNILFNNQASSTELKHLYAHVVSP